MEKSQPNINELESLLFEANEEYSKIIESDRWMDCDEAHGLVLKYERELSNAKNEPYAVPFSFPVEWDIGAPLPQLLCNDDKTYLAFYMTDVDPNWDGTSVRVVNPSSIEKCNLCLVTFHRCSSAKLGHPNDEVFEGHPLHGHGADSYSAQIVKNSPWIKEIAKNNSVHDCDDSAGWAKVNHYIFWFHDTTFECIADEYSVEVFNESMPDLLGIIVERLV